MRHDLALLACGFLLAASGPALAQSMWEPELRGGLFGHSVDEPGPSGSFINATRIQDANVELLFSPDWANAFMIGELRPHVGATLNFGGLESMAYAGLSWTIPVLDTPAFIEGSLGGAIHNGTLSGAVAPLRNLGCPVLFRESASLGWNFSDSASVMVTVEHASHAGLCGDNNRGLTNLGVRFGYRF
jgi:lipid A 3-O-deacylase